MKENILLSPMFVICFKKAQLYTFAYCKITFSSIYFSQFFVTRGGYLDYVHLFSPLLVLWGTIVSVPMDLSNTLFKMLR